MRGKRKRKEIVLMFTSGRLVQLSISIYIFVLVVDLATTDLSISGRPWGGGGTRIKYAHSFLKHILNMDSILTTKHR